MMDDKITDDFAVENPEVETKDDLVLSAESVKDKKRAKEKKGRKKNDKRAAEQYLKSLHDVHTTEEKLEAICEKYSEIVDENRKLQLAAKQAEKKIFMLLREKEQYQGERTKAVLTRKKLESLCRELQKQNKAVKEESLLKIREEEEKRKEVSAKLQDTLDEIKATMNQNIEKGTKLCDENVKLNMKYTDIYTQMGLHKQEMQKLMQVQAETEQSKKAAYAEKEALLKDQQRLLFKLSAYEEQIRDLQSTEVGLRSQISLYTDKYDEFQNTLDRSNKVYGEFNEEIERMSKKILILEKETGLWKQRWEKSHVALLEMASDKQVKDKALVTLSKKVSVLEDLCKMLQRERTGLLTQLREKTGMSACEIINKQEDSKTNDKPAIPPTTTTSKDCSTVKEMFQRFQVGVAVGIDLYNHHKNVVQQTDSNELKAETEESEKTNAPKLKTEIHDTSEHQDEGERDPMKDNIGQAEVVNLVANGVAACDDENGHIGCNSVNEAIEIKNLDNECTITEISTTAETECSAPSGPDETEDLRGTDKSKDSRSTEGEDDNQVVCAEVLTVFNRLEDLGAAVEEVLESDVNQKNSTVDGITAESNDRLSATQSDKIPTAVESVDNSMEATLATKKGTSSGGPMEAISVPTVENNLPVMIESPVPSKNVKRKKK